MKITTVNYPNSVQLPYWTAMDAGDPPGFNVLINGAEGRVLSVVGATVQTTAFYDNLYLRNASSNSTIYLSNGTGLTGSMPVLTSSWLVQVGAAGFDSGYFELTLEIETGVGTGEFVPLAQSGLEYATSDYPGATIVAEAPPAPVNPCFWTDLVRVTQVCPDEPEEPEEPEEPSGITRIYSPTPYPANEFELIHLIIDLRESPDFGLPMRVHVDRLLTDAYSVSLGRVTFTSGSWFTDNMQGNLAPDWPYTEYQPTPFAIGAGWHGLYFETNAEFMSDMLDYDLRFEVEENGVWRSLNATGVSVRSSFVGTDMLAGGYVAIQDRGS